MDRTRYFSWLLCKISPTRGYGKLLSRLYDSEFRWDLTVESDRNRADDGKNLRLLYSDETGERVDMREPCNILEMLIALSQRIEIDIMGDPGNNHPERWFWEMIKNLGLNTMTDGYYDDYYVGDILGCWMARVYDPRTGIGSLFPLKHTPLNQRKVPIWDQMGAYLNEYY